MSPPSLLELSRVIAKEKGAALFPEPHKGPKSSARLKAAITESVILKQRETRASGIQLLTSFMLVSKGTSREVITHLNRMGICMSYSQT